LPPAAPQAAEQTSRVRIKPQPMDREAMMRVMAAALRETSREALEQIIAEAEANNWSREEIADRVIALELENAGELLTVEERAEFAVQVRERVLGDPRFR